ncbi:Peptidase M50B-like [Streptomyces sp. DvalAA-14]|uniref:M50 family metallopeptidase n=1 Tax=unclassified Streptomyces TaxID=2593676 RepID=UPI00081B9C63|nr:MULTISPECIES: M50 family metallopeptidase [unclassified Streptomyces]MYS18972.1 M50 family peptidase [Streptomyces sp. SID4948]SCD33052.1 Peptidase M50B-like [Streptomyces sp. DvalAA-14]
MNVASITEMWHRLTGSQPDPSRWLVLATALIALAAVLTRSVWKIVRNAVTIAHEGGHGLVALLTGRRLDGIRLHSDTSGLTVSRGKPHGPGMVLTAAAGYTAPPLLGLAGAALLAAGHITALLWGATALLLVMLVMIRNAYGALTVVITAALFLLVSWLTKAQVQAAFAYLAVWFLLAGGSRPVAELQRSRRRDRSGSSDADQLARLTHTPAALWMLLFYAVALLSLVGGARWLLLQ